MRHYVLLICLLTITYSVPGEWMLLGEKKVSRFGKGVINVFNSHVTFSGIKLRNTGGRLRLISIVVHFSNKTREKLSFPLVRLKKGEETKFLSVDCRNRNISRVSVHYVTALLTKNPRLQLWGWRNVVRRVPRIRPPVYDYPKHDQNDNPRHDNPRHDNPRHDNPRHDNPRHDNPRYDNQNPKNDNSDVYPTKEHYSSKFNWQHLGSKKVNFRQEYDTIVVGKDKGAFLHLQLEVQENDVFIENVTVYFHNNQKYMIRLNQLIPMNGVTKLTLEKSQFIDHVTFKYASNSRGRQALVHLLGVQGKKIVTMTKKAEKNWNLLGQTNVSRGEDLESVYVYGSERTVSRLRVNIRNNKVHISQAVVYFSDDTRINLPISNSFQAGEASRPFELGSKKVVKRIDFVYQTEGIDYSQQSGVVEVWGH